MRGKVFLLAGALAFGLAARALLAALGQYPSGDGVMYLCLAKNLAGGEGYAVAGVPHIHFPPLYPIMVAGLYLLGIPLMAAGLLPGVLLGASGVVAAYLLGREWGSDEGGVLAAWLWALHPHLLRVGVDYLTEGVAGALLLWAVLALWRARGFWGGVAAGALAAGCFLTRQELGVLLAFGVAFTARRPRVLVGLAFGFGVAAAPWALYTWAQTQNPLSAFLGSKAFPTLVSTELASRGIDPAEEVWRLSPDPSLTYHDWWEREGAGFLDFVLHYPDGYLRVLGYNLRNLAAFLINPFLCLPWVILGAFGALGARRRAWVLGLLVILLFPYVLIVFVARMGAVFLGPVLVLAGVGLGRFWRRSVSLVLVFLALGVGAWAFVAVRGARARRANRGLISAQRRLGERVRGLFAPSKLVVASNQLALFSGADPVHLPRVDSPDSLALYMRLNRVQLALLGEGAKRRMGVSLEELIGSGCFRVLMEDSLAGERVVVLGLR